MSIRELFREFVVAKRRIEDERDARISLAWQIEAFHRQQKLPDLKALLRNELQPIRGRGRTPPSDARVMPERQTPAQQLTMLRLLSETYGLKLKPAAPKASRA